MSKQVHWQLPFGNIDGTKNYRIDIYDDPARSEDGGQSWPVQLVGAATPFVTDEDNSDDFFEPVRSQTGVINVVDEGGELMKTILPAHNLDHPVRLMMIHEDGTEEAMWQGFMSCETYTQPYIERPTEISFNVMGMVEATKSMRITSEMLMARCNAYKVLPIKGIAELMIDMLNEYGFGVDFDYEFGLYYFFEASNGYGINPHIFSKEESAVDLDGKTTVSLSDAYLYDLLEYVCVSLGLCLRESRTRIYFQRMVSNFSFAKSATINREFLDQEWKGTGHQINRHAGARRVIVNASVDPYNKIMEVPACPDEDLVMQWWQYGDTVEAVIRAYFNKMLDSHNTITSLRAYGANLNETAITNVRELPLMNIEGWSGQICWKAPADAYSPIAYVLHKKDSSRGHDNYNYYTRATLCKMTDNGDGLYVSHFVRKQYSEFASIIPNIGPIYSQKTIANYFFSGGSIIIDAKAKMIGIETYKQDNILRYRPKIEDADNVRTFYSLRVGNKYYQGDGTWGSNRAICGAIWKKGTMRNFYVVDDEDLANKAYSKFKVYVPGNVSGDVEFMLWPLLEQRNDGDFEYFDLFYSGLSMEYQEEGYNANAKSEIEYKKVLNAFGEDKTIDVSLMSRQRSAQGINYFLSMQGKPIRQIALFHSSLATNVIPEQDLLDRMAAYYRVPRNVIELEVTPLEGRLPDYLLSDRRVFGKTVHYKCLSESRDWKADTSTITCFECPE